MPNYSKAKIYKIVCNITGETYYGSTTQPLSVRIGGHRKHAKKEEYKITSKPIILRGNYDIVLCEECPCENKEQLHARERKWIEENECVNKVIPGRTPAEWREANNEYQKNYQEANQEQLKQKCKEYREANQEQIKQYQKQYREANKEYQKNYQKNYQKANKEQRAAKKAAKKAAENAAKTEELTYEQMIDKMTELHKQCDELIIKLDNLAK